MAHAPILILLPVLLTAFVVPLVGLWRYDPAVRIAQLAAAVSFAFAVLGLGTVLSRGPVHYYLGGWAPPLGIEYVLDPLSAFVALIVTFVGLLALIYARQSVLHELPEKVVPFFTVALLLLAGLIGIVVTGDLFNLYVFLEIASLTAYALMAIGSGRAAVASLRYLILGTVAGSFYVLGVGFLYFSTGSLNMADVARLLPPLYESRPVLAGAILIVVGLTLKMALFPMHIWLPDAYTYAPSAVSGLIAPIMTKVMAYALVRLFLDVFQPAYLRDMFPITSLIGWLAAAGIIVGSVMAIAQADLRRMLAYSSVGQIAFVALGIGLGNPLGLIGALLHILNHAFMKGCLFLIAGAIRYRAGTFEIPNLGGLGRRMPWTTAAFTVAALSMVGVPPAAGFFSKWYLVLGSIAAGNWLFVAVIVASSLLTCVYFFRVLEKVYLTLPSGEVASLPVKDPPAGMLAPILLLAAGVVVIGLMNAVIVARVLEGVAARLS